MTAKTHALPVLPVLWLPVCHGLTAACAAGSAAASLRASAGAAGSAKSSAHSAAARPLLPHQVHLHTACLGSTCSAKSSVHSAAASLLLPHQVLSLTACLRTHRSVQLSTSRTVVVDRKCCGIAVPGVTQPSQVREHAQAQQAQRRAARTAQQPGCYSPIRCFRTLNAFGTALLCWAGHWFHCPCRLQMLWHGSFSMSLLMPVLQCDCLRSCDAIDGLISVTSGCTCMAMQRASAWRAG